MSERMGMRTFPSLILSFTLIFKETMQTWKHRVSRANCVVTLANFCYLSANNVICPVIRKIQYLKVFSTLKRPFLTQNIDNNNKPTIKKKFPKFLHSCAKLQLSSSNRLLTKTVIFFTQCGVRVQVLNLP